MAISEAPLGLKGITASSNDNFEGFSQRVFRKVAGLATDAPHSVSIDAVDEANGQEWRGNITFNNNLVIAVRQESVIVVKGRKIGLDFSWGPSPFRFGGPFFEVRLKDPEESDGRAYSTHQIFGRSISDRYYGRSGPIKKEEELRDVFGIRPLPDNLDLWKIIANIANNRFALHGIWPKKHP